MSYYHFACHHSAESIDETLVLQPHRQPMLANLPLIWFTTLRDAKRAQLGLSSVTLECDRMDRLYQVIPEDEHLIVRWGDLKRHPQFSGYLAGARRLESVRGTWPGLWAVAVDEIRVVAIPAK